MTRDGEIYRVSDEIPGETDQTWYEYRVWETDGTGLIVREFDSLVETYNGMQKLTKNEAIEAMNEIIKEGF